MSIRAGLVGLPNVGKSTLFNALTRSSVPAENYPFCTIDPHIACASVPDERLEKLQAIYHSQKIIPSIVQFVDIAGLVKGAASGEGLGNQFLSHIREVDLILHVVRCFTDPNISSTREELDPLGDYEIVVQELMLKDIESIEKRKTKVNQLIKSSKNNQAAVKELTLEADLLERIEAALNSGHVDTVRTLAPQVQATMPLLSGKNFLIIANISEREVEGNQYEQNPYYRQLIERFGPDKVIAISARLEYELSQLNSTEAEEMMQLMGLAHKGLNTIIKNTYEQLGLITFFTCGPQEIHAWPLKAGTTIRTAGGEIHSDLERGFISSDVFNYADLALYQTTSKLKEAGKMRTEGQDYRVKDGDIIHIKFNV